MKENYHVLSETEQYILLYLISIKEGVAVKEIYEEMKLSPNAVTQAVNKLLNEGLLIEKREEVFPRKRLIYLSDKGRKIAQLLLQMQEIIKANQ
ncbi:MarR family transcriptional regulator [Sulfolobus sp. S-194]|uniref:MarR family transcriptional regulator n=1 Tax=Sulfolobus sp. S-194 TaxID=2512240 RepID=UPI001436DC75|nr:MarR family transcriptional regulator [Sulfolobus sp. S-194]QIW23603.1 MarR family transcriptional regulator [Sulfolobus sp. S-194]